MPAWVVKLQAAVGVAEPQAHADEETDAHDGGHGEDFFKKVVGGPVGKEWSAASWS